MIGLALVLLTALPALAATLRGTVSDLDSGAPLPSANIEVVGEEGLGTASRTNGRYLIDLPPGRHTLRVSFLGYATFEEMVEVPAAGARRDVALELTSVFLDPVVVSASRHAEKITDAPAAITVIGTAEIEARETSTAAEHIAAVKGIDYTKSGLDTYQINARGMNSTFPRRMLVMTDNRSNLLPGIGIVRWSMLSAAAPDLDRIEVVTGPASALYGNAALSGTVLVQTKSPLDEQGLSATLSGGERSTMKVAARYAGLANDDLGYKISVERFQGDDWERVDETANWFVSIKEPTADSPLTVFNADGTERMTVTSPDFGIENTHVDARVDWDLTETGRLSFFSGWSQTNSITLTGLGRYQIKDWQTGYGQLAYRDERFFVQGYVTGNDAGDTYNLISGSAIIDRSIAYDLEAQHNFTLGDRASVIWGGNYRQLNNDSEGTFIPEKKTFDLFGAYTQAEFELASTLDLIGAFRIDTHPETDAQYSPKAGFVWKPLANHTFRATYNKAFQNPIFTEFFLELPVGDVPAVDQNGIVILAPDPADSNKVGPLLVPGYATGNPDIKPEEITTFEFGYQGLIAEKWLASLDVHQSRYDDFISDLMPYYGPLTELPQIDVDLDGEPNPLPGRPRLDDNGNVIAYDFIGYTNFGPVDVTGFDLGLTYLVTPELQVGGTYSYLSAGDIEAVVDEEDFAVDPISGVLVGSPLNAPENKFTLNALYRADGGWSGSFGLRWVEEFEWGAGLYEGTIPSYTVVDGSVGYAITGNVELSIIGTNILDDQHVELIGAPEIGRQILGRISVKM